MEICTLTPIFSNIFRNLLPQSPISSHSETPKTSTPLPTPRSYRTFRNFSGIYLTTPDSRSHSRRVCTPTHPPEPPPVNTISQAFDTVCTSAVQREVVYLVLYRTVEFYGGPEEGGWYGHDEFVEAYQEFPSRHAAEAARTAVEALAARLTREAEDERNRAALRACERAYARGEDLDGPDDPYWTRGDEFRVVVQSELPSDTRGNRVWE